LSRGGLPLMTGSLRGIDTEGDEAIKRSTNWSRAR
jgi:hypothetical protein